MGRRLLFLGPPGAGKGTQATRLATAMGVPHISTGDMLRQNVADGTDLGKQAKSIMHAGDLVPDDLVLAMVYERLGRADAVCGFILDGFPRNVYQAEALAAHHELPGVEQVLLLDVDTEILVKRLMARAEEQGRADDNEDSIRNRLDVYTGETSPLIEWYPTNGVGVSHVNGVGRMNEVTARLVLALAE